MLQTFVCSVAPGTRKVDAKSHDDVHSFSALVCDILMEGRTPDWSIAQMQFDLAIDHGFWIASVVVEMPCCRQLQSLDTKSEKLAKCKWDSSCFIMITAAWSIICGPPASQEMLSISV